VINPKEETVTVEHVNPPSMANNPAFSQGTIVPAGRLLFVGGQNGVTSDGTLLEGAAEQTAQAMRNLLTVLEAAGASATDVAKLTIQLRQDVSAEEGFAAAMPIWGGHPTAVTVLQVAGFARPGVLVEIDAVAALP
jgi:enamine deaminase RidA (YjgF/YER057c/UK114 family)